MSLLILVASTLFLAACNDEMVDKGRVRPQGPSSFYPDNRSARGLVAGTVARGQAPTIATFIRQNFNDFTDMPKDMPLTMELLRRGQERFNIYCSVCHGADGNADGMIVRRGFTRPPSFVSGKDGQRLRDVALGHFVDVITNGYGAMYSYSDRVELPDRWAIAAYIRALQLAREAPVASLPPEMAGKAKEASR